MMIHTYQFKMKTDDAIKNKDLSNILIDIIKETMRSEVSIVIKQMLVEFLGSNKEDSSVMDKVQDPSKKISNV